MADFAIPRTTFKAGATRTATVTPPAGATRYAIDLAGSAFTQAARWLDVVIEFSVDGGATWLPGGGIGLPGGGPVRVQMAGWLPRAADAQTRARVAVTATGGSITLGPGTVSVA